MSDNRCPWGNQDTLSFGEQAAARQAKKDLAKLFIRVDTLEKTVKALQQKENPNLLHPRNVYSTTYHAENGICFDAVQISWAKVRLVLGRHHQGSADDDWKLVSFLRTSCLIEPTPGWIQTAPGWLDEKGWGLIGPQKEEQDGQR